MTQRRKSSIIVFERTAMKGFDVMSQYKHLSIYEREKKLVLSTRNESIRNIAKILGRSASTISREIKRNISKKQEYSAVGAQKKYEKRRKKCRRKKLLAQKELKLIIKRLFLEEQWSPEEISNRLLHENSKFAISYSTIYRGIYAGVFNEPDLARGNPGAIRKLRHHGKTRHIKGMIERRGKIIISNRIDERPSAADKREKIGHWEADTVAGKTGSSCLVTLTDTRSRYLLAEKIQKKNSGLLASKMVSMFSAIPEKYVKTITPDRGKEFSKHAEISKALNNMPLYFADPHYPWQRGTNENTNGLIREYLPKSFDIALCPDSQIATFVDKLNKRPRKCLNWKSPFELFFKKVLHLT